MLMGVTGWLARRIINRAARRLPYGRSESRREEWLAEYDAIVAKGFHIAGVLHACGTYLGAVRIIHRGQHRSGIKRILSDVVAAIRRPGLPSLVAGTVASTASLIAAVVTNMTSLVAGLYNGIVPMIEQLFSGMIAVLSVMWSIRAVLHARSRQQ
jgi:hypothetical protein